MSNCKNILVAPLDWGLGHATRCIPMIRQLKSEHNVMIACSGSAAALLKNEFPDLKHFPLPSYRITYPVKRSMSWHMALHFPTLWATILQEKKAIRNVIKKNKIDLIISDNRFGAHSNEIPSVFITHQVNIKTPHLNKWVNKLNHRAIKKFSYCWIPDLEVSPGLAGELSHPPLEKIKSAYIGPQSRFRFSEEEKKFDITVVLSGPEPQRTSIHRY
jgi:UDP:flavonoid glycosyltransferase YjiC (YdhE family)